MHRQLRNLTGTAAVLLSLAAVSAAAHPHGHGHGHGHRAYHHYYPPHVTYHPGWSVCFGTHGRRHRRSGPFHHLDLCVGDVYPRHWVGGHRHRAAHRHSHRHGHGHRHRRGHRHW